MPCDLSIVIPAYNEESRITGTLETLADFCRNYSGAVEIIVVDDGSSDLTVQLVQEFQVRLPELKLLQNPVNQGKGAVVRQGMLASQGNQILMTDADLSSPLSELPKLITRLQGGADICIGSRALLQSQITVHQPWYRELFGRTFNLLVRAFYLPRLRDTQCGFKLFTRSSAQAIFPHQQLTGMVFDVEVLYIAQKMGFRIEEEPVRWENSPETKFHPTLRSALEVISDLWRIGRLHRRLTSSTACFP